jgi:alkylation response protein AidB-like acyl-CoA dehydrogenase
MTGLISTQGTSEMHWEPDSSLIDAAREIAPIIRKHSEEAERERRLSRPVLEALRETGLLRMTTPRSLRRPTLSPAPSSVRRSVATTLRPRGLWRTLWTGPSSAPVSPTKEPRRSTVAERTY